MFAYLKGIFAEKNPSYIVVDCNGVGYHLEISLTTYTQIKDQESGLLYVHFVVREDQHILYGFADQSERQLFRQLISVSGVGAATARVMLSSLSPAEISQAILNGQVPLLQSIKGIGAKTAQRIVLELQDKISKENGSVNISLPFANNKNKEEALSALVMLGFSKVQSEKILEKLLKDNSELKVEELVKQALKLL